MEEVYLASEPGPQVNTSEDTDQAAKTTEFMATANTVNVNNITELDTKDYSDPEVRHNYIKTLLKGKCPENSHSQKLVENLFKKCPSLVKCPNEKLGFTDAVQHEILYNGPPVIYIPPYKHS